MSEKMRGEMPEAEVKRDLEGAISALRKEIEAFNQTLLESEKNRGVDDPASKNYGFKRSVVDSSDLRLVESDPQFWTSPATFARVLDGLKNKIADQVLYYEKLESEKDVFMSDRQRELIKERIGELDAKIAEHVDLEWLKNSKTL
jgi:hypothetical protein